MAAIALAIAALAGVAACGGSDAEPAEPELSEARPFADAFVRRLVQGGDIEDDASFEIAPDLSRLQDTLARDGVRKVDGPGRERHDCPENPAAEAGRDCIVYGLSGTQTRPVSGNQAMNALLRIWVRPADDGDWEVNHYQYDLRLYEVGP